MSHNLLAGVRVLDLSRLLPGGLCSLYLADLGADVVKIEAPDGGDYTRAYSPQLFRLINRNKRSVCMNLRRPEAADALKALARDADVVLESFRPGVVERLGVGYEALKAVNPRLVYCSLTGYGQTGPYRDRAGHDINYSGYAGVLDQTGVAGGPPALTNLPIGDLAGGSLTAAVGILAALFKARTSGEGTYIDAAMLDGTLALQVIGLSTLESAGSSRARGGDLLNGGLANYNVYACVDGRHLAVGALEPKFFGMLYETLGCSDLADSSPDSPATRERLATIFAERTREEWLEVFADRDACVTPVLTLEEALEDPQVRSRGIVHEGVDGPYLGHPLQYSNGGEEADRPAPGLGEHTEEVLGALGPEIDVGRISEA